MRDDFKDYIASPWLYYPGMLLSLTRASGGGPEQFVTVLEVRDHKGPWVTLVYRPTTRMDRVRGWFRARWLDMKWEWLLARLWLRERFVAKVEDGHG